MKTKIAEKKGKQIGDVERKRGVLGLSTEREFEAKIMRDLPETPLTDQQIKAFKQELSQRQFSSQGPVSLKEIDDRTSSPSVDSNGTN